MYYFALIQDVCLLIFHLEGSFELPVEALIVIRSF